MSWHTDPHAIPVDAWVAPLAADHAARVRAEAAPGSAYAVAVALGLSARLQPAPETPIRRDRRPSASPELEARRAWARAQVPEFWADLDEGVELGIESAEARIDDLDASYAPGKPVWRGLFRKLLWQRERLACAAWTAAVGGHQGAWREALQALDARGARLMAGALDLQPVEDAILSALGATEASWWTDPEIVEPVRAQAAQAAPTPDNVLPFNPRPRAVLPAIRPAEQRLAADDGEVDGTEGKVWAHVGLATVRVDGRPGEHVVIVTGPIDLPFNLDDDDQVSLVRADTGVAVQVRQLERAPRLWAVAVSTPGDYLLRVGEHTLAITVPA